MTAAANVIVVDLAGSRIVLFHHVNLARHGTGLAPDMPAIEARQIEAFHVTILERLAPTSKREARRK